jgi:hypothetical protein
LAQAESGKLLCLAGANTETGVCANTPIGWESIAASRLNGEAPSKNVRAIAQELGLELEGFVFVSADPAACAELRANCPEVTVAQLPADAEQVRAFLSHFWAFDTRAEVAIGALTGAPVQLGEIAALSSVDAVAAFIDAEKAPRAGAQAAYAPPGSAIEEMLADIWARMLRVDRPGIYDNFFALGGHSLLAAQVVARVRQVIGVEMPLRTMFDSPTIAEFAERVESERRVRVGVVLPPLARAERQETMPLSHAQQRLWFIDQLEPGNPLYNIPQAYRIRGALDVDALARSVNEIVRRHESLRTTFRSIDGQPVQVIAPELRIEAPLFDLSAMPADQREAERQRLARTAALEPFDLAQGPLLRAHMVRMDEAEHYLVLVLHHIVGDGWSGTLIAAELATHYEAFSKGQASPLPELGIQYPDFAVWQRQCLEGEFRDAQVAYWRTQLEGAPAVLELPTDRQRPAVQSHRGAMYAQVLPSGLIDRLKAVSQAEGVTLFMTLLGGFQVLLGRYSGQDDIVVGSPIAGRNYAEIEPMIGFFVNTLAMRTSLEGEPTVRELLARVRKTTLGAYAHQEIPFEKLVEDLQPVRSLSYNPIFQVLFGLQNIPKQSYELSDIQMDRVPLHQSTSIFDMSWFAFETPEGLLLRVEYDTDLFDESTIGRALRHYAKLLEGIAAHPESRISELPLLGEEERRQVLEGFNNTAAEYPKGERL